MSEPVTLGDKVVPEVCKPGHVPGGDVPLAYRAVPGDENYVELA
jgi:hypothetical protein